MPLFKTNTNFRYPWRPYQKRILDNLEDYLEDKQLHIVAPPGSGKTVLGLEVTKRLNQPTLILAPTITIRNQWAERLKIDFLQNQSFPNLSFDVKNPNKLTISTYQGLHIAFKDNPKRLLKSLKKLGIKTLVVDECHHLKNEWWKTLFHIKDFLHLQIVALTATPPFDVSGTEWQRYHELCGEVDAEINIAELVADENLCPHQDYIYFSTPTTEENIEITQFHDKVNEFIDDLKSDYTFREWIKNHPYLQAAERHLEAIYETPDYFSALLIVNEFFNGSVPLGTVEVIGGNIEDLPSMDEEWLQLFLNHALFKDIYFRQFEKTVVFKDIIKKLKKINAIERKKVVLIEPENINKKLRLSTSKLNSITTIVEHEWQTLKDDLRMVILTDYIRKEEMPTSEFGVKKQEKIGVVPIFERLRKRFPVAVDLGVLTGTLVIIPKVSLQKLERIIVSKKLNLNQLSTKTLAHDNDYLQIESSGELRTKMVEVITELFTKGSITVLVGTKALLGEGWDAPAVNTLILATFVGSYVLSNQMRGRAIRTQKGNKDKTANIWHLVCLDPTEKYGGHDFQILKRRFKAFHGVGFAKNPMIENGMNRFLLPPFPIDATTIETINNQMLYRADNRQQLRLDWEKALGNGMLMVEEIKIPIVQQKSYQKARFQSVKSLIYTVDNDWNIFKKDIVNVMLFSFAFSLFAYFFATSILLKIIGGFLVFGTLVGITKIPLLKIPLQALFATKKWIQQSEINPFKPFSWSIFYIIFMLIVGIVGFGFFFWTVPTTFLLFFLFSISTSIQGGRELLTFELTEKTWHYFNNFNHETHLIQQTGTVILQMLVLTGYILQEDYKNIRVEVEEDEYGEVVCYLNNATTFQNELFLEALREIYNPTENPRYLLSINRDMIQIYDEAFYINVPTIFSKNKKDATAFSELWQVNISINRLIYTRTQEGRLELLKARNISLNLELHPKAERLSAWR